MTWRSWLKKLWASWAPRRRVTIIEGDTLPDTLPFRNLVLAREDGEDWCIGMRCPCGCGERLELMLLKEVRPRWDARIDQRGHVTLHPSVWLKQGCRSHFWLRDGRVIWCE
ncbi:MULTISPECIES: DUF6527 family protein [unclassified Bradyrhizobium]|uniref:DUF6527 family protein n=1 Tax=unclassified Bradyrhizobium TaxID=2631580 RepID=UPI0029168DDB|nr:MULTISPECIES: DUF6527 family protein [unclassified Bradyrhizobium]